MGGLRRWLVWPVAGLCVVRRRVRWARLRVVRGGPPRQAGCRRRPAPGVARAAVGGHTPLQVPLTRNLEATEQSTRSRADRVVRFPIWETCKGVCPLTTPTHDALTRSETGHDLARRTAPSAAEGPNAGPRAGRRRTDRRCRRPTLSHTRRRAAFTSSGGRNGPPRTNRRSDRCRPRTRAASR